MTPGVQQGEWIPDCPGFQPDFNRAVVAHTNEVRFCVCLELPLGCSLVEKRWKCREYSDRMTKRTRTLADYFENML